MEAKYKVGQRVMIKEDAEETREIGFSSSMRKHRGTVMTIREVCEEYGRNEPYYYMVEDIKEYDGNGRPGWMWTESWLTDVIDQVDSNELMSILS